MKMQNNYEMKLHAFVACVQQCEAERYVRGDFDHDSEISDNGGMIL
jgi:hypothetical protein